MRGRLRSVMPSMLRAVRLLCRLFSSEFPHEGSRRHVALRGVSMPACRLVAICIIGVIWGMLVSAVAYWIAVSLI